ncbi:uncharacterized protein [Anabrus simplex]|uniref:uncharacterized protein n=1 Tax=Anabrus simplex TaxID=316456 RepID=UPI0035A2A116
MLRMNSKTDAQLLDERIAQIRKKNEERHKRYLEVEADKQNAAKENALVQLAPPKDNWCAERAETYNDEPRRSSARGRIGGKLNVGGSDQTAPDEDEQLEILEYYSEGKPQRFSKSKTSNNSPRYSGELKGQEQLSDKGSKSSRRPEIPCVKPQGRGKLTANVSESGAVSYVFPEGEGPPPDPAYNFLADAERDPVRHDRRKKSPKRKEFPRNHVGNLKGRPPDMRTNHDGHENIRTDAQYEAWKAERDRIDQERINRQKTPDGQWRREWDKGKVPVEAMDDRPLPRNPRGNRRDVPSPGYRDPDPRTLQDFVRTVELPGNRHEHVTRKLSHEKHRGTFNGDKGTMYRIPSSVIVAVEDSLVVRTEELPGKKHEHVTRKLSHEKPRGTFTGEKGTMYGIPSSGIIAVEDSLGSSPKLLKKERNVKNVGNSLVVSVPNESTANQSPKLQRVKVNTRTAIGSGRVGPRQKVRLSYSSQSEDEITHPSSHQPRTVKYSQPKTNLNPKFMVTTSERSQCNLASAKPPHPPLVEQRVFAKARRSKQLRSSKKIEINKYPDHSTESQSGTDSANEHTKAEISGGHAVRENESDDDGDDSWEDVATTSGNESMSTEDSTPIKKMLPIEDESAESKNCPEELENSVCGDETMTVIVEQTGVLASESTQLETPLSNDKAEEFCEKGSFEPSEKHDTSSEAKTISVEEGKNIDNCEGRPVDSKSTPVAGDNEKECLEVEEDGNSNEQKLDNDTILSEEVPKIMEHKELNVVTEDSSNTENQMDSNILTEQNSKTELT